VQVHLLVGVFALILLVGVIRGFRDGLIRSAFKLLGLAAGYVVARPLAKILTPYLEGLGDFELPTYGRYLLLFACFAIGVVVFGLLGWLISRPIHWSPLKWVDKLSGAGLGLLFALLVIGLIFGFLDDFDWFQTLLAEAQGQEARFLNMLGDLTPDLTRPLGRVLETGAPPARDGTI